MRSPLPQIDASWREVLAEEFNKSYFKSLENKLLQEEKRFETYPLNSQVFASFNATSFQKVQVVILGQDPYHGPGQANGLAFSVAKGIKLPPSLKNIYKELHTDLGIEMAQHGDLSNWAKQGVLLLNAFLTVRKGSPGSHRGLGWEHFTDEVIRQLSEKRSGIVFLLWGNFARTKKVLIDEHQHLILEAPHPSPFSAYTGFFGCQHFSKANQYLRQQSKTPIDWQL